MFGLNRFTVCRILVRLLFLSNCETLVNSAAVNSVEQVKGGDIRGFELRKCCQPNEKLLIGNSTDGNPSYHCVSSNNVFNPALFKDPKAQFGDHEDLQQFKKPYKYIIGFPNCDDIKEFDNYKDIWFEVQETGVVLVGLKFWFKPVWLPVLNLNQSFCLDELDPASKEDMIEGQSSHNIFHRNQVLLHCGLKGFDQYLFHRILFGTLCCSAATIIFALLVIYLSIWDRQNLAGWTQFNIFVAVFFVFGMEGVRTILDYDATKIQATTSCMIIAAIAQYFFFALNTTWCVMNFDLFLTFWKLESSSKGTQGHGKRIFIYFLFSWALPFLVIIIAFGIIHLKANASKQKMEGVYAYAHRRCSSPIREFGFQTQGVMFLCNLLFFLVTAFMIWKHRRGINVNRKNSRTERHTWQSVILFAKLLIVMGVAAITVPLNYFFASEDPLSLSEVVFRMFHFIPVVGIFFIFGFNERNIGLIKQKYPNFGKLMGISLFTTKPNTTDTNPSQSGGKENQNCTDL